MSSHPDGSPHARPRRRHAHLPELWLRVHGPEECLARTARYRLGEDCHTFHSSRVWWMFNLGLAQVGGRPRLGGSWHAILACTWGRAALGSGGRGERRGMVGCAGMPALIGPTLRPPHACLPAHAPPLPHTQRRHACPAAPLPCPSLPRAWFGGTADLIATRTWVRRMPCGAWRTRAMPCCWVSAGGRRGMPGCHGAWGRQAAGSSCYCCHRPRRCCRCWCVSRTGMH